MFYQTTVKSVGSSGVVDVQGKFLTFIGNLPVKEGDTVFTDGKVIFGHAPSKGSTAIFDEPGGIPVLGYTDENQNDELRGYFTTSGKFKKYRIKGDNWITNSKKQYAHDDGGENIIDAEIALDDDGNEVGVYTVEKKITQITANDADFHWGFYQVGVPGGSDLYPTTKGKLFGRVAVVTSNDNFDDVDEFKPDAYVSFTFTSVDKRCSAATGYYNTTPGRYYTDPQTLIRYDIRYLDRCLFAYTDKFSFLDFRRADDQDIRTCELIIRKDGQEIERLNLAETLKDAVDAVKAEVDALPERDAVKHSICRGYLHNFKILPDGNWELLIQSEIWAAKTFFEAGYNIDKSTYPSTYTPAPRHHIVSAVTHRMSMFKISSRGTTETIWDRFFRYPAFLADNYVEEVVAYGSSEAQDAANDKYNYYDGNREYYFIFVTLGAPFYGRVGYTDYATSYNPTLDFQSLSENPLVAFPVQDDYYAELKRDTTSLDERQLVGVYDKSGNLVVDGSDEQFSNLNNAHKWNMSLATLKGGGYLFGVRDDQDREIDGKLYRVTEDGIDVVGYGLKNFRLRELKKLSKAKK